MQNAPLAAAAEPGPDDNSPMATAYRYVRGATFSYTKFKEYINDGSVKKVVIHEDNTADFIFQNLDSGIGGNGKVYLAPDPDLSTLLQSKGIDLSIDRADQTMQ